jgi:adenine-specific DNA-methyltransferase
MVLNYIGSKLSLLNFIEHIITTYINNIKVFGDLFSGTCSVSHYFNQHYNWKIINNDCEFYSYVIARAMLVSSYNEKLSKIIENINQLDGADGLIVKHYSPKGNRLYFTLDNARKIDAIRIYIQTLLDKNEISGDEYMFLLASLLESADKVANVSCVYGAFLKKFKKSSLKPLTIVPIHKIENKKLHPNQVFNKNVIDLLDNDIKFDVVYLDPPYNQRQYGANYFVLNYIANYKEIEIKGITGIPVNYYKSPFCSKTEVENSIKITLNKINSRYILISYNNEGLLNINQFQQLCSEFGNLKTFVKSYKKFKAQQSVKTMTTYEYIHLIDTENKNNTIETIEI